MIELGRGFLVWSYSPNLPSMSPTWALCIIIFIRVEYSLRAAISNRAFRAAPRNPFAHSFPIDCGQSLLGDLATLCHFAHRIFASSPGNSFPMLGALHESSPFRSLGSGKHLCDDIMCHSILDHQRAPYVGDKLSS